MADRSGRPVIAVTGPARGAHAARRCIALGIRLAGGRALQLAPGRAAAASGAWRGVVISGGTDVHPQAWGAQPEPGRAYDGERDAFEREVIGDALRRGLPILGICRGAQLMNVHFGGSLHRDVRTMRRLTSNRASPLAVKTLRIHRGSRLHEVMATEQARINSLHRQGIDRLGDDLEVSGHDLDDIVQAVERVGPQWCIGVQWHPEYLFYLRAHRRLFRALVAAAQE